MSPVTTNDFARDKENSNHLEKYQIINVVENIAGNAAKITPKITHHILLANTAKAITRPPNTARRRNCEVVFLILIPFAEGMEKHFSNIIYDPTRIIPYKSNDQPKLLNHDNTIVPARRNHTRKAMLIAAQNPVFLARST